MEVYRPQIVGKAPQVPYLSGIRQTYIPNRQATKSAYTHVLGFILGFRSRGGKCMVANFKRGHIQIQGEATPHKR